MNVARYSVETGNWGTSHVLDDNLTTAPYALVADSQGGVTIAWTHGARIMDTPAIHAARFDASVAAWSVPAILSAGGDGLGVSRHAVAIDASGVATVAWTQQRGIYGLRSERSAVG